MPRRLENINNLEVVQTHKTSVPKLSGNGSVITYQQSKGEDTGWGYAHTWMCV